MDKVTITFLALVILLFVSALFFTESFADASGNDASGNVVLSLKDLFSLIGSSLGGSGMSSTSSSGSSSSSSSRSSTSYTDSSLDAQFVTDLKKAIVKDVREEVKTQLGKNAESISNAGTVLDDSCIDSMSNQQGADFMRYIPGKNPADYIRKDSIPCYSCNLETN